jgi:hypothetical protein
MESFRGPWCAIVLLMAMLVPALAAKSCGGKRTEHTHTYLSPALKMRPGDVKNKYFNVEAPLGGHFATVNFEAELVYEDGEPVLQNDVYLHHWSMLEYAVPEGAAELVGQELYDEVMRSPPHVYHRRPWNGVGRELKQAWAMGGETRHLNFEMPAPYGLECGGEGIRTQWVLNVHAVDTRGALDRMGCYECKCHLFTGINHANLPEGYLGGMKCCTDESRCVLRDDVNGDDAALERTVHLKYTWTHVAFDECVVPVQHVGLDVLGDAAATVEYTVEGHCKPEDFHKPECVDERETVVEAEHGGDVVYVVAHLHTYSLGSTLWGEDGRVICHSSPVYGHGGTPGDEKGYVVGIRHCNPALNKTGQGKIRKGEKLRFQVRYSKVGGPHTGVMGVGFIKVAEEAAIALNRGLAGNRKIMN